MLDGVSNRVVALLLPHPGLLPVYLTICLARADYTAALSLSQTSLSVTDHACGVPEPGASWYVVRCASQRERSVRAALGLHGLATLLPSYRESVRWSDRVKVVERLLFPGYLFVRCSFDELPFVLSFGGVVGVLDNNLRPRAVADSEVDNLELVISSLSNVEPAAFVAGDQVTIAAGPLKGVSGVIVRSGSKMRLVVAVEMLGRGVSVEMSGDVLAKAKAK